MHDPEQDQLIVARMTYFRTKWLGLPAAYAEFLDAALLPGAPVSQRATAPRSTSPSRAGATT